MSTAIVTTLTFRVEIALFLRDSESACFVPAKPPVVRDHTID